MALGRLVAGYRVSRKQPRGYVPVAKPKIMTLFAEQIAAHCPGTSAITSGRDRD